MIHIKMQLDNTTQDPMIITNSPFTTALTGSV